jgi:hypothetical protein
VRPKFESRVKMPVISVADVEAWFDRALRGFHAASGF